VLIAVPGERARSTILFDWLCTLHTLREPSLKLVLGYNTALFSLLYRLTGRVSLMNMDGIEWIRAKWGPVPRSWFYLNDWLGCWLSNHLIADHPAIAAHLATRVSPSKICTIPYGADAPGRSDESVLRNIGVEGAAYVIVVARAEPENSLLEIVRAYSRQPRSHKLVVLARLNPKTSIYHRVVMAAAGPDVIFPGAIYDPHMLAALRSNATLYIHGHQAGGTNPSLVEAMAAGLPVLAHDNRFNRWVAGSASAYFCSESACADTLNELLNDPDRLSQMARVARERHYDLFTWEKVCAKYEALLESWLHNAKANAGGGTRSC
jgi:glycosyltransferase involved in cell wall biosynthesis